MALILDKPMLTPWMRPHTRRNPGVQPLKPSDWLQRDVCFADQMALRDDLIANRREAVFGAGADDRAACEVLALVCRETNGVVQDGHIQRADGARVAVGDHPLITAGRLVQEDLLILQRRGDAWVLTDGVLCFPSHWTLSEKLGRSLIDIHGPVPFYAGDLERRVQRLFDAIRVEQPLWRANWLIYPDATLHYPRREYEVKHVDWTGDLFVRVERQSLLRMPETGAVVFSIKADICPLLSLDTQQRTGLLDAFDALPPVERDYKGGDIIRARIHASL